MIKEEMFKDDTSRIYKTRREANDNKKRGDRVYFDPSINMYYIVTPKRVSFWRN